MRKNLVKNTTKVSLMILTSRLLGLVRDVFIAAFIGAGPLNDAFLAAFKFTNLFRSIFAEGAMNIALLPSINQARKSHGENYLRVLQIHLFTLLLLALTIFSTIIFCTLDKILALSNPGFTRDLLDLTIELTYISFPYLTLVSVAAFYGALLQSKENFFAYSCNSIIMNLILILACHFNFGLSPVYSLSYGILLSGFLEVGWIIFAAWREGIKLKFRLPIISIYTRKVFKRFLPGIVTAGIFQISLWCNLIILSYYPGGMSYLYFADRFVQLPLALFSTASTIVLLSLLSNNQLEEEKIFEESFLINFALILPSALGLFLLSREIIEFFLYRGAFDTKALMKTSEILKLLAIALPFQSLGKIFATRVNAAGNTQIAMKISIIALIINLITTISLIPLVGYLSVGYGTIFSSISYLFCFAYRKFNLTKKNYLELGKYFFANCILAGYLLFPAASFSLVLKIISSIIIYLSILYIMKSFIIRELIGKILYKKK